MVKIIRVDEWLWAKKRRERVTFFRCLDKYALAV
jgi:hypothetical protein